MYINKTRSPLNNSSLELPKQVEQCNIYLHLCNSLNCEILPIRVYIRRERPEIGRLWQRLSQLLGCRSAFVFLILNQRCLESGRKQQWSITRLETVNTFNKPGHSPDCVLHHHFVKLTFLNISVIDKKKLSLTEWFISQQMSAAFSTHRVKYIYFTT